MRFESICVAKKFSRLVLWVGSTRGFAIGVRHGLGGWIAPRFQNALDASGRSIKRNLKRGANGFNAKVCRGIGARRSIKSIKKRGDIKNFGARINESKINQCRAIKWRLTCGRVHASSVLQAITFMTEYLWMHTGFAAVISDACGDRECAKHGDCFAKVLGADARDFMGCANGGE